MRVKSVIFDLDGTLVDSADDILTALSDALGSEGIALDTPMQRNWIGPPIEEILRRAGLELSSAQTERVVGAFRKGYDLGPMSSTVAYPGALRLLNDLKGWKIPCLIATNKPSRPTQRLIEALFPDLIQDFICVNSIDGRRLGKGDMIRELVVRHSLNAAEVLVVGDGTSDIQGALENGCRAIGVSFGYSQRESLEAAGAHQIVDRLEDLLLLEGFHDQNQ